jgi:hypothetical protein
MRRAFVVAIAGLLIGAGPAAGAGSLTIATSVSPHWLYFGDTVTARVDVRFDARRVVADSIRVEPSLAPWEQTAPARTSTTTAGSIGHQTWAFTVACISIDCLTRGTAVQRFHLPPVSVTALDRSGANIAVRSSWPVLRIAGRFAPAHTVGLRPVFQLNTHVPAATYRANPNAFALVVGVTGGLFVVLALALGAAAAVRWRAARRLAVDATPPLARALALVRESQDRDVDDRRRAASLLARTLSAESNGLRLTAAELAWSTSDPTPVRLEELVQAVETKLEESS